MREQKFPLDPPDWQRIPGGRVYHCDCSGTVLVLTGQAQCLRCQARWRQREAEARWMVEEEETG